MSAARYNDALKPLSPGDRVRAAVNADRQNALATLAQEAVQGVYLKGSGGIRVRRGVHGTTITQKKPIAQRGGGGKFLFAKKLDSGKYAVTPGLVNLMPVKFNSAAGDELDGQQEHLLPGGDLIDGVIFLVVEYNVTFVEDYLTYNEMVAVYTKAGETLPDDTELFSEEGSPADGWRFHAPLATIVGDKITNNYGGSNLWCLIRDNSTLEAMGVALAIGRSYP